MRFIRAAAIGLLIICVLAVGLAVVLIRNQASLVNAVLRHIEERTGYQITTADSRLHFGVHLDVVLDRPTVRHAGRQLVTSDRIRVSVSYHALIWNNGLPLHRIVVIDPRIQVPASSKDITLTALPRLDNAAVQVMDRELHRFSGLVQRLTIADAEVTDQNGGQLFGNFSLTASPLHRHSPIWVIGFFAPQIASPFAGLQASGKMTVNTAAHGAGQIASNGQLWYWNGNFTQNAGAGVTASGILHGDLSFVLRADGELDGSANVGVKALELAGGGLTRKLALGDYLFSTPYAISTQRVALAGIEGRTQGKTVITADATLTDPYAADAALLVHLGGAQIDLASLKRRLSAMRRVPSRLAAFAAKIVSGQVQIEGVSYQTALDQLAWPPKALSDDLTASLRVDDLRMKPPAEGLPELSDVDAQITYAKRRLTISQGSAALGASSFQDVRGDARLGPALRDLPYQIALAGRLDLDQLYPAMRRLLPALNRGPARSVERITGTASLRVTASGTFNIESPALPKNYRIIVDTGGFSVAAKGLPQTIALTGGNATLTPEEIELTRVTATTGGPGKPGNVTVNGVIGLDTQALNLRRIKVEMHQIQVQQWLPLLMSPKNIAARGPVGGSLTITKPPGSKIRAAGRLTMGVGQIELGFLRSPIITESATLTLNGRSLLLAIIGGKLEGSPLDLSLGVSNFDHPKLRIDANAGRLDLQVMKFIRVPWSKSPPAQFWPVPVVGHVVANEANLERLRMSAVSCDFERKANGDWRVYNFDANLYNGHAAMEFAGRGRDNWINIKGRANGVRIAQLWRIGKPAATPPLSGHMKAIFDIWANANTDFFNTIAGTISVDLTNGVLHKFALLSRVLGLINLKTWLSAEVPNPGINGVPFQSLTADFAGHDGNFYSDNLMLRGPVMNISARGNVQLASGVVNMEVGMVPFKTVNWLVGHVPIIGHGLAADHLMAAYFKVSGPLEDPYVVPLPITSVAHFLGSVLQLPINILKGVGQGVTGGGDDNGSGNSSNGGSAGAPGTN